MFQKYFKILSITMVLGFLAIPSQAVENWQKVKVDGNALKEDFDHDGIYKPFFVKGVGYAPVPIGHFMNYTASGAVDYVYQGVYPPNPATRFQSAPEGTFQPGTNGNSFYNDLNALDRDFKLLKAMNTNTIRTWGNVTPNLLKKANQYGIKVIAGYWIDHNIDFRFLGTAGWQQKDKIINDFKIYVTTLKNDPNASAILMWGLSNENNSHFCHRCPDDCTSTEKDAQARGFYQLVNKMAQATMSESVEGNYFHPTMIVVGELSPSLTNYAHLIPDIKMIGINSYRGRTFDGFPAPKKSLFQEFQDYFSSGDRIKGLLITEFGVDAWKTDLKNSSRGGVDEDSQNSWVSDAWDDIVKNSRSNGGPANGGVVFHYSDVYNKYAEHPGAGKCEAVSSDWTPSVITHDTGYTDPTIFGQGAMPDNVENPEWWGIVGTELNRTRGEQDVMTPRLVYRSLQQKFSGCVAKFRYPASGKVTGNTIISLGIQASCSSGYWDHYSMEYKLTSSSSWNQIISGTRQPLSVASWNTTGLNDGSYALRLSVFDKNGNAYRSQITIIKDKNIGSQNDTCTSVGSFRVVAKRYREQCVRNAASLTGYYWNTVLVCPTGQVVNSLGKCQLAL